MNVELLKLLTAKSSDLELAGGNHEAITPEDIAHFLGTIGLESIEYDFLMAKYTENNYAKSLVFDDVYEDVCNIFLKYMDAKELLQEKYLIRQFINLALRETIHTRCVFCQGRGTVATNDTITKCEHCDGTGQFIYNRDNRPELLNMDKKDFLQFEKPYLETLELIKNIEISALSKIGDDSE